MNIGIITDCVNPRAVAYAQQMVEEARVLLKNNYQVLVAEEHILQGDCSAETARRNLEQLLADESVDLIIGADIIVSHIMAKGGPYNKPVLASTVVNIQVQQLPMNKKGQSGVENLAYLELPLSPMRDLEVFNRLFGFENLAVVIDEAAFTGIPELKAFFDEGINSLGLKYSFVFTEATAEATLNKLNGQDAVYLLPSDRLSDAETQKLIDGINDRQLKSFSILGRIDVDRGVLAGVAPASNIRLFTRRMGLNIQRCVNKEDPEDFAVKINQKEELVLNMATARKIDYSPSFDLLSEAVVINEDMVDVGRSLNIFDAIEEGIGNNLSIDIAQQAVAAVQEDVNVARGVLRPDVSATVSHTTVDSDLANASNGQSPEQRGQGRLSISQIIYSEQAAANKKIQQYLLEAQEASLEVQTLDIILEVSTAYLQLMQAITLEKIQKENLDVTRKNLELARTAASIGQSGPSDLYRWQGEIANAKSDLIIAQAQRRQAEINLNQILNRPIDELFTTQEVDLNDSRYFVSNQSLSDKIKSPREFNQFIDFMVQRAMEHSPNLSELQANVRAQERSLVLNQRNRYVPTISLGGNYNQEVYRGGAGTEFPEFFQPAPNDWNWNLGLNASLPLYQGGQRKALVQQSKVQLQQIELQKTNLQRLIEQQVRSEMENIRASYYNITLTQEAAEAVVKNFDIVQDAYSQGSVLITQLLDAQNASISAQLNSANAVYSFLIDLLNMERATGEFYMLFTPEQKAQYEADLFNFISEQ